MSQPSANEQSLNFSDIANLINRSRVASIDLDPIATSHEKERWALYNGKYKVHGNTFNFEVLYLYAGATIDSIREAHRLHYRKDQTQVVYASSLDERNEEHHKVFSKAKLWNIREYLASFIKEELENYLNRLSKLPTEYYIQPTYTSPPGNFPTKIPNLPLQFLQEYTANSIQKGMLGVVLAEPGQGKTFESQHIVSTMAKNAMRSQFRFVPIYIDSAQWSTIPLQDLGSLVKTIAHSFRHYDATIAWLDGCEDLFLRIMLRAGLFRIVFDGFDEYILRNKGQVDPRETLNQLSRLASETGSRIIITARNSFWDSIFEESLDESSAGINSDIYHYVIRPFDQNNARNYFIRRFEQLPQKNELVNRADGFYATLGKKGYDLIGRGFVLSLVADLVERAEPGMQILTDDQHPLKWLLKALCFREEKRQALPLTAEQQYNALRQFTAEIFQDPKSNTSDALEYSIGCAAPNLDKDSCHECLRKLSPHPLLTKEYGTNRWSIKQEQLEMVFLADYLKTQLESSTRNNSLLNQFVNTRGLEGSVLNDLASMFVDLVYGEYSITAEEEIRNLVQELLNVSSGEVRKNSGRSLAVTIAQLSLERILPKGSSLADRTKMFVSLFGTNKLVQLPFSGTIARMDFADVLFQECYFDRVTWAKCNFYSSTTFKDCFFIGGSTQNCTGLGEAVWINNHEDKDASIWINNAKTIAGKRKYGADELQSDMTVLVNKFFARSGYGFIAIDEHALNSGAIGISPHKAEILQEFLASLIEVHVNSGGSGKGYNMREEAKEAARFFSVNNKFTGILEVVFRRLRKKLRID